MELLAEAADQGSLGLFIGSGFSMALTNGRAPTWQVLLQRVALDSKVADPFAAPPVIGRSFPVIATEICAAIYEKLKADPAMAGRTDEELHRLSRSRFKEAVAARCYFQAEPTLRTRYGSAFAGVEPSWIITTNYDLLIEECIPNSSILLPDQVFGITRHSIPVYHLHGHRVSPESIIMTEDDYVRLFRPGEYRQTKLGLLLSESTTVLLGYGLGDINILTAIDCAGFYRRTSAVGGSQHQGLVLQALYTHGVANPAPYRRPTGEIVLEIANIADFLEDLAREKERVKTRRLKNEELLAALDTFDGRKQFIDSSTARKTGIAVLAAQSPSQATRVLGFLEQVFDDVWRKARADGGWEHYKFFAVMLLDLLEAWGSASVHPLIISFFAAQLSKLSYYVDPSGRHMRGTSYEATDVWMARKRAIPGAIKVELLKYARESGEYGISQLLL